MVSENRTEQAEQGDASGDFANGKGQYLRGFLVETSVCPKNLDLGSLVAGLQADTASKSLRLLCRSNLVQ